MSDQNVKVVQDAYAAFKRADIQSILNALSPDVDWDPLSGLAGKVPQAGRRRGPGEVGEFFKILGREADFSVFEPREYIAQGDRVVALGHYEGRATSTGKTFKADWAMVFTIRNGKIANFREYVDTANVLAAYTP